MSETTTTTDKQLPNPQKMKWKNVAYYDTYEEATKHRSNLDENTISKIRRCGPMKTKYVLKTGSPIKETSDE